jgi:hypothetical protein
VFVQSGYDPSTHMSVFSALDRDDILGKISLLYPSQAVADGISEMPNSFTLPRLVLDGLFLPEKPPRAPKKLAPLTTGSYSSVTSNGGLISPQSPDRPPGRPIDPSLVSHLAFCAVIFRSRPPILLAASTQTSESIVSQVHAAVSFFFRRESSSLQ